MHIDSISLIPRWYSTKPVLNNLPSGFHATLIGAPSQYPKYNNVIIKERKKEGRKRKERKKEMNLFF